MTIYEELQQAEALVAQLREEIVVQGPTLYLAPNASGGVEVSDSRRFIIIPAAEDALWLARELTRIFGS